MTGRRDIAAEPEVPPLSLTAAAIRQYTKPGDLIVDLGCGDGRVLVEAIRADRLAIGIERSRRRAEQARGAVVEATTYGGPGFAAVVVGELADVPKLVGRDSLGKASLVFVDMARVGVLGEHSRVTDAEAPGRFTTVLDVCGALLRPGGHVLVSVWSDLLDEIKTTVGIPSTFEVEGLDTDQYRGAIHKQVPTVVVRCAAGRT